MSPQTQRLAMAIEEPCVGAHLADHFRAELVSHVTGHLHNASRCFFTHIRSTTVMDEPTRPLEDRGALELCVPLIPVKQPHFRLWMDGKAVSTPALPRFSCTLLNLRSIPTGWNLAPMDWAIYHLPHVALTDIADELEISSWREYRQAVAEQDPFVIQLTKFLVFQTKDVGAPCALVSDALSLLLATHVVQHYGLVRGSSSNYRGGLAPWQKRRATEILSSPPTEDMSLKYVAAECGLSVSYFARAFRESFGVPVHRWYARQRQERACDLLTADKESIAIIAKLLGFADQSTFSRSFTRTVGVSPNRWRQMNRAK